MGKNASSVAFYGVVFGLCAAGIANAATASFYFSPSSGTWHKGENFTASILAQSDVPINAIQGFFIFPADLLEVIGVSKNKSIVNLWVQEPSFSNGGKTGNVNFGGVILNPGFSGPDGKIIDVNFRIKNEGAAELRFLQAAILENDGLGTNITTSNGSAEFAFVAPRIQQAPQTQTETKKPVVEQPRIIIFNQPQNAPAQGILQFWEILPYWVKAAVVVLVFASTIILLLVFLSFGCVVLIYLWRYGASQLAAVSKKAAIRFKLAWHRCRRAAGKLLLWTKIGGREMSGDIEYAIEQLKENLREANVKHPKLFRRAMKDYWFSVGRIIKRFFTKNETDSFSQTGSQNDNGPPDEEPGSV